MEPGMMARYRDRGFVFVPGLLDASEIAIVRAELDRILAAHAADPARVILEKDGVTPRTVVNPHLHADVFARLVRHPALVDAARALLEGDVYVWQSGVNCKAAFDGDAWFWHQDYPAYRRDDHIPAPRMVNALVFFDEVSALNGPLMLVPGSQALTDDLPEPSSGGTSYAFRYTGRAVIEAEIRRRGVEAPIGPAGSVIFMNVNVLHGSAGNLSPWPRRMMTLTYNAFANKATAPSLRPRHIVPDDRDVPPLVPLGADCLASVSEPRP